MNEYSTRSSIQYSPEIVDFARATAVTAAVVVAGLVGLTDRGTNT